MVDRAQYIKKMTSQHEEGGNSFDKCIRLLHPFKHGFQKSKAIYFKKVSILVIILGI